MNYYMDSGGKISATTILAVYHRGSLAIGGDGQVTVGNTILKHSAVKIRRLCDGRIVSGFAGSAADAFTLFERFEVKLRECNNQLARAAIELAKDWRQDKFLRRLEALMIVADATSMFVISGNGDVIAPDDSIAAIGSGGNFALAAARAFVEADLSRKEEDSFSASEIVERSLKIAANICPFTNNHIKVEVIERTE